MDMRVTCTSNEIYRLPYHVLELLCSQNFIVEMRDELSHGKVGDVGPRPQA